MQPNKINRITLEDARAMEYAEYGDPRGEDVLFFHGFIGSYHQASPAHSAAQKHHIRLVTPNRAGVGHSSPNETATIFDRMSDVRQLLEQLEIHEFGTVGVSGGSPYALATAYSFGERVKTVACISGMGPVADPDLLQKMEPTRRKALQLAKYPALANAYLSWRMRKYKKNPKEFLNLLIQTWPEADQKLFEDNLELRIMFLGDLENVLSIGSGTKGLAKELQRYFHWGFDPKDVQQNVQLFHGTEDTIVPPTTSEYMADVLPHAEVSFQSGGHSMIVNIIDDVMQKARSSLSSVRR